MSHLGSGEAMPKPRVGSFGSGLRSSAAMARRLSHDTGASVGRVTSSQHREGAVLGILLAYGLVFFQVVAHTLKGELEGGEPPLVLHVARDGSLALPGVVLAVLVVRRLLDALPAQLAGSRARALATGVAGAMVMAAGAPVHERLFSAAHAHEHGGG